MDVSPPVVPQHIVPDRRVIRRAMSVPIRQSPAVVADDGSERVEGGLELTKSALGGVLVAAPALLLIVFGAQLLVTTLFLIAAVIVLSVVARRQRASPQRKSGE